MIISKTPYRISFCGGGSDLPNYYNNFDFGAVMSTSINKYMYVTVDKRFDNSIRLSYSKTEIVDNFEDIQHELIREAMRMTGVTKALEIHTIGDIPGGTGLGSSSVLTVGILNALYAYKGEYVSAKKLAEQACEIEINILKEPIGKQDQYAAAYGGLRYIQFNNDGSVFSDPVICDASTKSLLGENLIMFYLNKTRSASTILKEQSERSAEKAGSLAEMKRLARELTDTLRNNQLDSFGQLMHENWELKKQLTGDISNLEIDEIYKKGRDAGAIGGKVLGAGGGGFFLFYVEKDKRANLKNELKDLREIPFSLEPEGSKIIYIN